MIRHLYSLAHTLEKEVTYLIKKYEQKCLLALTRDKNVLSGLPTAPPSKLHAGSLPGCYFAWCPGSLRLSLRKSSPPMRKLTGFLGDCGKPNSRRSIFSLCLFGQVVSLLTLDLANRVLSCRTWVT